MVELKLDACKDVSDINDCFVSVRVGDAQKLSRLAKSRTYRFPQAGDRHFGKIEVFKRIGSCTVDIDPAKAHMREVQVDCGNLMGAMDFRVGVEADEGSNKKRHAEEREAEKDAQKKAETQKAKMAKEYLDQHGLEIHLSEAMQALLRERPENPTEYLAMKLMSAPKSKMTMGPPIPTKEKAQAPISPKKAQDTRSLGGTRAYVNTYIKSVPIPQFEAFYSKFKGWRKATAPAAGVVATKPEKVDKAYVKTYMKQIPNSQYVAIYGKFKAFRPPERAQDMRSMGSASYFKTHLKSVPISQFEAFYGKFTAFRKGESPAELMRAKSCAKIIGLTDASLTGALKKAGVSAAVEAVRSKASGSIALSGMDKKLEGIIKAKDAGASPGASPGAIIGNATLPAKPADVKMAAYCNTYILAVPDSQFTNFYNKFKIYKEVMAKVKPAPPKASGGFQQMSSVGTWLAIARKPSPAEIANAPKPPPYELPGAKAENISPAGQALKWTRAPSVGTWLAKPKEVNKAPEVTSFKFKPSVGTWLTPPVDDDEEGSERPSSRKLLLRTADLYGASFPMSNMIQIL